jgi:hypothetical protein
VAVGVPGVTAVVTVGLGVTADVADGVGEGGDVAVAVGVPIRVGIGVFVGGTLVGRGGGTVADIRGK